MVSEDGAEINGLLKLKRKYWPLKMEEETMTSIDVVGRSGL